MQDIPLWVSTRVSLGCSIFDGIAKDFETQAVPPQLDYHKVLCEVLNDAEEEEAEFDDKQEEEEDSDGQAGIGSFSTLRDALWLVFTSQSGKEEVE